MVTKGYIVIGWYFKGGMIMKKGILWHGTNATLFKSYSDARNAIKRSKTYAKKNRYDWDIVSCEIQRVVS